MKRDWNLKTAVSSMAIIGIAAADALAYNTAASGLGGQAASIFYTQILGGAIGAVGGGVVALKGFGHIINDRDYLHGGVVTLIGVVAASLGTWVSSEGCII